MSTFWYASLSAFLFGWALWLTVAFVKRLRRPATPKPVLPVHPDVAARLERTTHVGRQLVMHPDTAATIPHSEKVAGVVAGVVAGSPGVRVVTDPNVPPGTMYYLLDPSTIEWGGGDVREWLDNVRGVTVTDFLNGRPRSERSDGL